MSVVFHIAHVSKKLLFAGRGCGTAVRLRRLTAAVAVGIVVLTGCQAVFCPDRLQIVKTVEAAITISTRTESAADGIVTADSTAEQFSENLVITWVDADNMLCHRTVPADTETIILSLPACTVTPILVTRGTTDYLGTTEHPTGCIYPLFSTCSPSGGWTAHLLYQFLWKTRPAGTALPTAVPQPPTVFTTTAVRDYAATFNWKRLTSTAERIADPWQLDEEAILTAIRNGTFDKSLVTRPKSQ